MRKNTKFEFVIKANKIHNNTYDYSKVVYVNNKSKVIIVCPIHGDFHIAPGNHINGKQTGCPSCSLVKKGFARRTPRENYITRASKIHNNQYAYDNLVYHGHHHKLLVTCTIHGDFEQVASKHLKGHGCPKCSVSGFKAEKSATLYYLKIEYKNRVLYKIGITNRSITERFCVADLNKITVLYTKDYVKGAEAYQEEQRILKEFKHFKYTGPAVLESGGNTELFSIDILKKDIQNG